MFQLRGKQIAGIGPLMSAEQPAIWSTYVATDDADAVVARATEAGGMVIVEPMDVMDAGRMAFVVHPAGGAVGVWQANRHTGAELVNEPGALTWNQLHTRDLEGAAAFYDAVFGWKTADFGGMPSSTSATGGSRAHRTMFAGMPDDVPAFWMTVFGTADTDATAAKAAELGGQVISPPSDIADVGRFAVLADPQGVTFGVISLGDSAPVVERRHAPGGHSVRRTTRVPRLL